MMDVENLTYYKERLYQAEHAELDGRATDVAEIERTIRMCKRRIRDIEKRPLWPPQCATLAAQPGWAHPDEPDRLS